MDNCSVCSKPLEEGQEFCSDECLAASINPNIPDISEYIDDMAKEFNTKEEL